MNRKLIIDKHTSAIMQMMTKDLYVVMPTRDQLNTQTHRTIDAAWSTEYKPIISQLDDQIRAPLIRINNPESRITRERERKITSNSQQ